MEWPESSPELNPMENIWGKIEPKVYEKGQKYFLMKQMKTAIEKSCYELNCCYML